MKKLTIKDLVFIFTDGEYKNPCTGQVIKKGKLPKGVIIVNSQQEAERVYALNS